MSHLEDLKAQNELQHQMCYVCLQFQAVFWDNILWNHLVSPMENATEGAAQHKSDTVT